MQNFAWIKTYQITNVNFTEKILKYNLIASKILLKLRVGFLRGCAHHKIHLVRDCQNIEHRTRACAGKRVIQFTKLNMSRSCPRAAKKKKKKISTRKKIPCVVCTYATLNAGGMKYLWGKKNQRARVCICVECKRIVQNI